MCFRLCILRQTTLPICCQGWAEAMVLPWTCPCLVNVGQSAQCHCIQRMCKSVWWTHLQWISQCPYKQIHKEILAWLIFILYMVSWATFSRVVNLASINRIHFFKKTHIRNQVKMFQLSWGDDKCSEGSWLCQILELFLVGYLANTTSSLKKTEDTEN